MRFVLIRPPFVDLSYGPPIGLAHIQAVLRDGAAGSYLMYRSSN